MDANDGRTEEGRFLPHGARRAAMMINARMRGEYIMHSGTHVQHEKEIAGEEEEAEVEVASILK